MSRAIPSYDLQAKLLIVGDSGVGKSCLLLRFCENNFTTSHLATIGIDFKMKTIEIEGKRVRVQTWDTAGQEKYKTITQTYYRGANGIILTYAIDDRESFANVENWMKQIKENSNDNASIILVGNKSDLPERRVNYDEGKRLADSHGIQFFETSAKDARNINDTFYAITRDIKHKIEMSSSGPLPTPENLDKREKLKSGESKFGKNINCC